MKENSKWEKKIHWHWQLQSPPKFPCISNHHRYGYYCSERFSWRLGEFLKQANWKESYKTWHGLGQTLLEWCDDTQHVGTFQRLCRKDALGNEGAVASSFSVYFNIRVNRLRKITRNFRPILQSRFKTSISRVKTRSATYMKPCNLYLCRYILDEYPFRFISDRI
jgi:hypothetical protein